MRANAILMAPAGPEGQRTSPTISMLHCDICGAPAFSVAPGQDAQHADLFLLSRGAPAKCWCFAHWLEAHR